MANLLLDNAVMAQSMLERLKADKKREAERVSREIKRQIAMILSDYSGNITSRNKADKIIAELKEHLSPLLKAHVNNLKGSVIEASKQLAEIEYQSFKQIFDDEKINTAKDKDLYDSLNNKPLSLKNWSGQLYLPQFIAAWGALSLAQITNSVTQTFAESGSIKDLTGLLYSDHSSRFTVISKVAKDYDAIANTALQHAHSVAASTFYSVNPNLVQKEQFAAILDSRTSVVCRSLDGTTYPVGQGARPPLHIRCRSRMLPVINKQYAKNIISGDTDQAYGEETYYEWLGRQTKKRQDIVLGTARGQLFRDGGLTAKQFADLQLTKNFKPMTLEAMKRIIPEAFERAGLN